MLRKNGSGQTSHTGKDEIIKMLRVVINKEQELYRMYTELAEKDIDEELKETIGHLAYEEFVHLNTIIERYKLLVDEIKK